MVEVESNMLTKCSVPTTVPLPPVKSHHVIGCISWKLCLSYISYRAYNRIRGMNRKISWPYWVPLGIIACY